MTQNAGLHDPFYRVRQSESVNSEGEEDIGEGSVHCKGLEAIRGSWASPSLLPEKKDTHCA